MRRQDLPFPVFDLHRLRGTTGAQAWFMVRLMILARGIQRLRLWSVMLLATALLFGEVPASSVTRPILFVTQVPIAPEINDGTVSNVFVSVVSALGNHPIKLGCDSQALRLSILCGCAGRLGEN